MIRSPSLAPADISYRGHHTAPVREGRNTIDDLSDIFPDDIYDKSVSWQYYGHGERPMDIESARVIAKTRNNPDADVTVYRAVPKGVESINPGDWVTTSKIYANQHGRSLVDGDYHVIEKKVKAKELVTDGNSMHEWGYSPR